jgi:hypothetical protein
MSLIKFKKMNIIENLNSLTQKYKPTIYKLKQYQA